MRQSRIAASAGVRSSRLWLAVAVMLFFTCTWSPFSCQVEAAHSRRRGGGGGVSTRGPGSPRYDRSITTFDRSGRLLQVEYGMEAADRGETVVAVWTAGGIYVLVKSQASSSSQTSSSSRSHKVHQIDEHLWLFTAGLSGDASALASSLPPRKDARPRHNVRPQPDRRIRKVHGLQDSGDRSCCDTSVVHPSPDCQSGDDKGLLDKCGALVRSKVSTKSHQCPRC